MAEKKKILYIVEAMGGGAFTYIVDLANITLCVTELTSSELLTKVLQVIRDVK